MAFSSMLLGGTRRPPCWKVFFRFCSHAFAMPETFWKDTQNHSQAALCFKELGGICTCFYPDTVHRCCERPAAGISAERAWEPRSSDGTPSGCTEASSLVGNYRCRAQERTDTLRITDSGTKKEMCCGCQFVICGSLVCGQPTYGLELVLAVSCLRSWQ